MWKCTCGKEFPSTDRLSKHIHYYLIKCSNQCPIDECPEFNDCTFEFVDQPHEPEDVERFVKQWRNNRNEALS